MLFVCIPCVFFQLVRAKFLHLHLLPALSFHLHILSALLILSASIILVHIRVRSIPPIEYNKPSLDLLYNQVTESHLTTFMLIPLSIWFPIPLPAPWPSSLPDVVPTNVLRMSEALSAERVDVGFCERA